MRKRAISKTTSTLFFAIVFATLGLISVAARANDPWKDKDPDDWDAKDVQKILTDSPWSKQFQYGMASSGSLGSSSTAVGREAHTETADRLNPGNPAAPSSTDASPGTGPVTKFTVSWHSSRTVREAILREKELTGSLPDQARRDLSAKYDVYEILVSGTDLRAFGKAGAENLKAHTYLMSKNSKEKIAPSKVVVQTSQNGNPVAILFDFPQKTATGEPTISAAEKSAEFAAKAGDLPLKVSFDISKMSTKRGPDL